MGGKPRVLCQEMETLLIRRISFHEQIEEAWRVIMDSVNSQVRSRIMSKIRKKGNRSTERRVRAALVSGGLKGWCLHHGDFEGAPDFAFPKKKIAIFIDGCFWHGCSLCYRRPKSKRSYWDWKLARNVRRDKEVTQALKKQKILVLRFWEHEALCKLPHIIGKITMALKKRGARN